MSLLQMVFKGGKWLFKSVIVLILGLLLVVNGVYLTSRVYNFDSGAPFKGDVVYNPYHDVDSLSLYRGNFHAHSIAWKGMTDGRDTEEDVFNAYVEQGYDIPALSNYHHISTYGKDKASVYIPVYEHGYNIKKSHLLAIDAQKVSFFDFLFWQTSSHQQHIIDHLRGSASVIAIAHPKYWNSRSLDNMTHLVNYDLTEILNHNKDSEEFWDAGLSAGKLTWCLGDDDTHGLKKEPTFKRWNMIFSEKRDKESVLDALMKGQHYSVFSPENTLKVGLASCHLTDSTSFEVIFTDEMQDILFIGQEGVIKQKTGPAQNASYTFRSDDTYVRVVALHNDGKIYLNPLVRYDGETLPLNSLNKAEMNVLKTWGLRALFLLPLLLLMYLLRWIIKL